MPRTPCRAWFRAHKTVIQTQSSPRYGPSISSVFLPKSYHDYHNPRLTTNWSTHKKFHQRGWRHTAACRAKLIIAAGGSPKRVRPSAPVRRVRCTSTSAQPACNLLLNSSQLHPSLSFLSTTRPPPTRSWQTTQTRRPIFPGFQDRGISEKSDW
ncbi:hypothetical protein LZ32DRAFT_308080 [Colletotrichum eremochloae]|nr:hypothetical protein LZ32DRAFT_308080 [Colletotrichum eremochloae]